MADYTDDEIEEQAQRNVQRRRAILKELGSLHRNPEDYPQDRPRNMPAPAPAPTPPAGPVTILRGGRDPEVRQSFRKGGMVRKHGSPTDCGPLCRDSKTIRR